MTESLCQVDTGLCRVCDTARHGHDDSYDGRCLTPLVPDPAWTNVFGTRFWTKPDPDRGDGFSGVMTVSADLVPLVCPVHRTCREVMGEGATHWYCEEQMPCPVHKEVKA